MRKFYTLLAAVVTTATFAQTPLNTNGSLENWEDATTQPEGWFINSGLIASGAVSKQTGGAQDGENFVKIVAPGTNHNSFGLADIDVTEGETYTVTYYYKELDNGNARLRHWGQWRDENASITPATGDPFQANVYIFDTNGEWTKVTATSTPPAGATKLRFSFRNYPQNNSGGGSFGIDNVTITQGTPSSLKDNNIEGLAIYPNPATDQINIASNGIGTKQVTIFDLVGKKVIETSTNQTVNVSGLKAGIYLVNVQQDGKSATRKLVIK